MFQTKPNLYYTNNGRSRQRLQKRERRLPILTRPRNSSVKRPNITVPTAQASVPMRTCRHAGPHLRTQRPRHDQSSYGTGDNAYPTCHAGVSSGIERFFRVHPDASVSSAGFQGRFDDRQALLQWGHRGRQSSPRGVPLRLGRRAIGRSHRCVSPWHRICCRVSNIMNAIAVVREKRPTRLVVGRSSHVFCQ